MTDLSGIEPLSSETDEKTKDTPEGTERHEQTGTEQEAVPKPKIKVSKYVPLKPGEIPRVYSHRDSKWELGDKLSEETHNLLFAKVKRRELGYELKNYIEYQVPNIRKDQMFLNQSDMVQTANDILLKRGWQKKQFTLATPTDVLESEFLVYLNNHPEEYSTKSINIYGSYIFKSETSLRKFSQKEENIDLENMTYKYQSEHGANTPICNIVTAWLALKKKTTTGSTRASIVTASKIFLKFLQHSAKSVPGIPDPSSATYSRYTFWSKEVDLTLDALSLMGVKAYKLRKAEARTNRNIDLTLNNETRQAQLQSVQAISSHAFFLDLVERAGKVSTDNPQVSQFDSKLFNDVSEVLAIIFITHGGQRPEIINIISHTDVLNLAPNTEDESLFRIFIQEFFPTKDGKTRSELRLTIDLVTRNLLYKFMSMKEALGLSTERLFTYYDGKAVDPFAIRGGAVWQKLDLDKTMRYRLMRQEVSTFFATVSFSLSLFKVPTFLL